MLSEEKIQDNYETFCVLAEGIESKSPFISNMFDKIGDRIGQAPATVRSYPGGLVEQNLKCLKICMNLNKTFSLDLPEDSMIFVNLFRNIGMLGRPDEDLMIPEENDWALKKGTNYKYNNKFPFMHPHDRSIYLLNHFNVPITEDEHIAILTSGGNNEEYNRFNLPVLSFACYTALRISGFKNS